MENRLFENQNFHHPDARLLGIGLDNEDGHHRITRSERFSVIGGSQPTHEHLTSLFLKTFEDLDQRGQRLDETEPDELADILNRNCNEF